MPFLPDRLKRRPLVSVVVCTKNGMPYVREAMASLDRQTYRKFEVVVQDAASTDGTAEFLSNLRFKRLKVVSEPDGGIGDAYNRAFARAEGAIVTTLDADNLLEPDALERAVALFREHPGAAAVYGAVQMIDGDAAPIELFVPEPFEIAAVLRCELVVPFSTSFFSRKVCGLELRCDPSLETCADFDLWLRLSQWEILRTERPLGRTRLSPKSMTRDPSRYEQFCRDKITALERHLDRRPELTTERSEAIAGIYCWAAESLLALEGRSERCEAMVERAAATAPNYGRFEQLAARMAEAAAGTNLACSP
jgi:glycosyltransferase involved in cell wall biosynthesis